MGFLKKQAQRLRRESWEDINEFAEEMYAIFHSDDSIEFDSPVTITNNTGGSALTINQGDVGDTTITVNNYPGPAAPNPPGFPPAQPDVITNYYITNIYGDGTIEGFPNPPLVPPDPGTGQPVGGGGGGGFPCVVVSGSGTTYSCNVYTTGLAGTPILTSVRFLGLSPSATLPAGTESIANLVGAAYFSYVASWL